MDIANAATLLVLAKDAVAATRQHVDKEARISHVGFRSTSFEAWNSLLGMMKEHGEVCMTYKPDGREIPFVKLKEPLVVGGDVLGFIEIPAPKAELVDEPLMLVVYQNKDVNRQPLILDGYDVREQAMHAEDFIARDKGR